mmetsp:Transcript_5303/g.19393  ORF Transcript_5303/g.19393 Transcript_5303/m.19393 type:complete len:266 (+) Transcript_5303:132-929(+)
MVLDYSKFNNIVDSDDEEEEERRKEQEQRKAAAAIERSKQGAASSSQSKVKVDKPHDAKGSAWNMNSWHYEEQDLGKWGKRRLQELLKNRHECFFEHDGLELEFEFDLSPGKVEGDCWTHIRKGKKVVGFDYELSLRYSGALRSDSNKWLATGRVEYEFTVDDDDPSVQFTSDQSFPFHNKIKAAVLEHITARLQVFVSELRVRGGGSGQGFASGSTESRVQVGQYQKYDSGPDGVANLQKVARDRAEEGKESKAKHLHCPVPTH